MSTDLACNSPLYSFLPSEFEGFDLLAELAMDMRWSWNHAADELWQQLDPGLWELTENPWVVLQTVSQDHLKQVLADPAFREKVDKIVQTRRKADGAPGWFEQNHPQSPLSGVAYFSMEFMLSEALPIYSGGLGNVAGDQLKASSDLGVPVTGIGLLYQQGYFRQVIDDNGTQQALFPYNDPGQLPITPLRYPNGEWLRLEIKIGGYSVWLRVWQVRVGRSKLYLLDSNDAANFPAHRGITSELYGGGPYLRLKQELILGVGGWRLLAALGIRPEVCHLNEGHAAFLVLERAADFMAETGEPFEVALAVTRAGNHFTTHTAVAAGFDRFPPDLIKQYLASYAEERLGITADDLLALGRANPNDSEENFNMAYLAIRGSGSVNGVSRLHGEVSRQIFAPLFYRWPRAEVPVGYVTNGVHVPSWDSAEADDLWTKACGNDRWLGETTTINDDIRRVSDEELWDMRCAARQSFVSYARRRLALQLAASAASPGAISAAGEILDGNVLTLGFARRFATYKRPNLLLHDPERLIRLLTDSRRPVQLILAGKAHPEDLAGQEMIKEWVRFMDRPQVRSRVVFLSDYDMLLTMHMVQGVDVWINTPRRPWEASGTSGMKVLVNGGLNLSELDGWWAEAYVPEVGWSVGDGSEHGEDAGWDAVEAGELYDRLEGEIIPQFYDRNDKGIPTTWLAKVRESMARLTSSFSANRCVREYTEEYYLPAAAAYRARSAVNGALGREIYAWRKALDEKWSGLRFGALRVTTDAEGHLFEVEVHLNGLNPDAVRVELYADGPGGESPVRRGMELLPGVKGEGSHSVWTARVAASRPVGDYTPRVIPYFPEVVLPLENAHILWER